MIRFPCPHCRKPLKIVDAYAGRRTRCPSCNEPVRIPDQSPPETKTEASPDTTSPSPHNEATAATDQAESVAGEQSLDSPDDQDNADAIADLAAVLEPVQPKRSPEHPPTMPAAAKVAANNLPEAQPHHAETITTEEQPGTLDVPPQAPPGEQPKFKLRAREAPPRRMPTWLLVAAGGALVAGLFGIAFKNQLLPASSAAASDPSKPGKGMTDVQKLERVGALMRESYQRDSRHYPPHVGELIRAGLVDADIFVSNTDSTVAPPTYQPDEDTIDSYRFGDFVFAYPNLDGADPPADTVAAVGMKADAGGRHPVLRLDGDVRKVSRAELAEFIENANTRRRAFDPPLADISLR